MLREGYSRHHLPCYGFGEALAGILASIGTTAATAGTAGGVGTTIGAGVGAAAIPTATLTGTSLGAGLGTASGLSLGATAGSGIAASGAIGTTGLGLGAGTAAAAGGAGTAAAAGGGGLGITAGGLLQAAQIAGSAAGAGNSIYSGQQQAKAAKVAANQAAKQARAEQISYQDRVRDVLSLNVANAAARGVAQDGSAAQLQLSNLEGGQLDLANIASDASSAQRLYGAARRRSLLAGNLGAAQSVFTGLAGLTI